MRHFIAICLLSFSLSNVSFAKQPTILISIDGFAHYYLDKFKPEFLTQFAKSGVKSEGMISVYPSKTFPNHLSMVTGQPPAIHGLVHNKFYNREIGQEYRLGQGKDNDKWVNVKPIWEIAKEQGVESAIYFWPESETKLKVKAPKYNKSYKHNTPNEVRLDQVVSWLELPEAERPQLLITYISTIDSIGHHFGTDSEELADAVQNIDLLLKRFVREIKEKTQVNPNIVIVSDHGMVDLDASKRMLTKKLKAKFGDTRIIDGQTQLYIYEENKAILKQIENELPNLYDRQYFTVYSKGSYPAHWQFNAEHPAIPDMIVEAKAPSYFISNLQKEAKGTHGFDPITSEKLDALFIANGPNFKSSIEINKFDNTNVFYLLTHLLDLQHKNNSEYMSWLSTFVVK